METRARKKTLNTIMVALIAIIAGCGIMVCGYIQGWFGGDDSSDMVSEKITGVVNVERSGIGYSLEEGVTMQAEDIVETSSGSGSTFSFGRNNELALNENTELRIPVCEKDDLELKLDEGELFAEVPKSPENLSIAFGKNSAAITGTVFSLSQRSGSSTLSVYEGSVSVTAENGSENTVEAGKSILITRGGKDDLTVETDDIRADSLSDYLIDRLLNARTDDLCFSADELNKVKAAREKEKQDAAKALEDEAIQIAQREESAASGPGGSTSEGTASASTGGENASSGSTDTTGSDIKRCTISIRCKSILSNMDKLKEGKNRYVPSNGIILATSPVEFREGETAYDVTKRACSATGIQIEASYSPVYGSYYVEGINHLYEFDCGEMSGWLYKVNGWTPNYGSSEYKLKNGDSIVWDYTCTGN